MRRSRLPLNLLLAEVSEGVENEVRRFRLVRLIRQQMGTPNVS